MKVSMEQAAFNARRLGVSAGDLFARCIQRGGVVDYATEEAQPTFEQVAEHVYLRRVVRTFTVTVTEKRLVSESELVAE
jgi:hypothetical protein